MEIRVQRNGVRTVLVSVLGTVSEGIKFLSSRVVIIFPNNAASVIPFGVKTVRLEIEVIIKRHSGILLMRCLVTLFQVVLVFVCVRVSMLCRAHM